MNRSRPGLPDAPRGFPWGKLLLAVALIAGLTAAWRLTRLAEIFTADNLIAWADAFSSRWWAPLVIILAYTPASIVMFPRPLLTLTAVVSFGAWAGLACALAGVVIASAAGFYAGRTFGRETVHRLAGPRLDQLTQAMQRGGVLAITAVRLVPLAPFIVESMVAGAIRIKLWHLSIGTVLGMLPGALTATVLGDALESSLHDPATINWWWVAGAVSLFAVFSYLVARWLNRAGGDASRTER